MITIFKISMVKKYDRSKKEKFGMVTYYSIGCFRFCRSTWWEVSLTQLGPDPRDHEIGASAFLHPLPPRKLKALRLS